MAGAMIPRNPFRSRKRAFHPVPDGYTLTDHDVEVLQKAIGDTADILRLEAFLRAKCSISSQATLYWLTWPQIIVAVEPAIEDNQVKPSSHDAAMGGEERAVAILIKHPDWTDKRIAEEAGLHPKTLVRYRTYKAARALLNETGKDSLLRGHQTTDGDVE